MNAEKRFMDRPYRDKKLRRRRDESVEEIRQSRLARARERAKLDEATPMIPAFSPEFVRDVKDAGTLDTDSEDAQ